MFQCFDLAAETWPLTVEYDAPAGRHRGPGPAVIQEKKHVALSQSLPVASRRVGCTRIPSRCAVPLLGDHWRIVLAILNGACQTDLQSGSSRFIGISWVLARPEASASTFLLPVVL